MEEGKGEAEDGREMGVWGFYALLGVHVSIEPNVSFHLPSL